MDRRPNQRRRPDTVLSNESVDSIYLQYGVERDVHTDDHGRASIYNIPGHEASTATLITPPSNTGPQRPNSNSNGASHILARNNGVRGHRRQNSIASSFESTETLPAYSNSQDNLIDPPRDSSDDSHQADVDRSLSRIYSLYRRDTRSHINSYIPRVPLQPNIGQGVGVAQRQGHHRRQTSDFSLMSNDSNLTLVHSNASHMDVDLEKGKGPHGKSKLGLGLGNESESTLADLDPIKGLPMTPVTPTPKRVLKRTGLCCGLCCFATLVLACICAVSFMMLMVNANLDGWGHRNVVHMPFGFKSPRQTQIGGADGSGKPTSVLRVFPTVSVTKS